MFKVRVHGIIDGSLTGEEVRKVAAMARKFCAMNNLEPAVEYCSFVLGRPSLWAFLESYALGNAIPDRPDAQRQCTIHYRN